MWSSLYTTRHEIKVGLADVRVNCKSNLSGRWRLTQADMKSACAQAQTSYMRPRLSGPWGSWNISVLLHNKRRECQRNNTWPQPAPITRRKAECLSWKCNSLNTCDLKVRYCVPWPVVSLYCPCIMQPVSGGSSFSHSPTHELWVAGRLTGLDTGESAWVEREQPWEQCLPATLETVSETCQPPFQLKSQNRVVYCTAAQLGL